MICSKEQKMAANSNENKFSLSWHDSAWIPILNAENILDYFCQRSNTFYDKTCNNEHVKMQRLDPGQMLYMTGIEYTLIHAQDPILYVIRKQMRISATQVTPLAFYYILAGYVYQCPDVGSLINSRLLSTIHKVQSAFADAQSYSRYNPSKGYWWEFKDSPKDSKKEKRPNKALEPATVFQRQRVDLLLSEFALKFPPKTIQPTVEDTEMKPLVTGEGAAVDVKIEPSTEKTEDTLPLPAKENAVNKTKPIEVTPANEPVAAMQVDIPSKPLTPASKRQKKE